MYLVLCGIGAPAFVLGCAGRAQARAEKLWQEGNGKPVVSAKDYDPARSLAPVVKAVRPAVVRISVSAEAKKRLGEGFDPRILPFLPDGIQMPVPRTGTGSGFIIASAGLVVTNHHVVAGTDHVEVKLSDDRTFEATVLGSDEETDLALLKLRGADKLPTVALGSSEQLEVGDRVFAIGSPLGLENSVTTGIVSGKGRGSLGLYRESFLDFIQIDAGITQGNSGGPLFNLNGEVVGINTAVGGPTGGLGFSIPIDQAKWIIPQLKSDGKVSRGWLGISGRNIEPASSGSAAAGATIGDVHDGTPAARAGLEAGDRIVKIADKPIEDFDDLRARVAQSKPGTKLELEIERNGDTKKLQTTLGERPHPDQLSRLRNGLPSRSGGQNLYGDDPPRLGVNVEQTKRGVVVRRVDRGSLGADLGLREGDILDQVNGRKIERAEDVGRALARDRRKVSVKVRRGSGTHTATIQRM